MNGFLIHLCWKNLWRNKRRTLLAANAIGFGVMVLVWLYNHYDAVHAQLISNAVSFDSGHLVLSPKEYEENKPVGRFIRDSHVVTEWVSKRPEVKSFSPQIVMQGMLSSPQGSLNIWLKGVDASHEKATTQFASKIILGTFFLNNQSKPIVIGTGIAKNLKLTIGSKVDAFARSVSGSIRHELFTVAGIFQTDSDADKLFAFTSLPLARNLVGLKEAAIHRISVVLHDENTIDSFSLAFDTQFKGKALQVQSWREVQKHVTAIIELDKSANRLIMWIILFVASLGIVNAVLAGLLERNREFGVMLAIGTTRYEVMKMVLMETLLLSFVGVLIGNAAGILLTLYFHNKGFDLKWLTSQPLKVGGMLVQTVSYPNVSIGNSLLITSSIFVVTLLISLVPLHHIFKLNVVRALNSK